METWSDAPSDLFRIKFFLDTNILTYLIDKTYPGLSTAIDYFNQSSFTSLISSNYVIFEFVGVRKREHYLREVIKKYTTAGGDINMSSLLKYKEDFAAPEAKFDDVKAAIKANVERELHKIVNDFGIIYENNLLHNKLLSPTFDINLTTKVSKEDSLVLVSSLWPDELTRESFICLISNDEQFVKGYSEFDLTQVFSAHTLNNPVLEHVRSMKLEGNHHLNLTDANDDRKLSDYLPKKIKELLIKKNERLWLGRTIRCGNGPGFPTDVVCFQLNSNTVLQKGVFLTIVGANLDFIYNTKVRIEEFWDQTRIQNYPYVTATERAISFRPFELDSNNVRISIQPDAILKLREPGNLVFVNPDSFI